MKAEPFEVTIGDDRQQMLCQRLEETRWPQVIGNDAWIYGVPRWWTQGMINYWANDWDWSIQTKAMNKFQRNRTELEGIPIHFLHLPRAAAAEKTNLQRWEIMPRGGHFGTAEMPELEVEEIREFFPDVTQLNGPPITAGQAHLSADLLCRVSRGFAWIYFTVHRVPAEHLSSPVFDTGVDHILNRRTNLRLYETSSSHSEDYLLKLSF